MSKLEPWITMLAVLVFCGFFVGIGLIIDVSAQDQKVKQTDYKDLPTRHKIDRDLYEWLRRIEQQTQADTFYFTVGNTADTIYLPEKYADTHYQIFISYVTSRGMVNSKDPQLTPLTDSSFVISTKYANDSSTVQWMTIHK